MKATVKLLVVGNSLVLHGKAPQIGWYGEHGMAASSVENDLVHQLASMLEAGGREVQLMLTNAADFERDPYAYELETLRAYRDFNADLIVVRLCENVPADKLRDFGECLPKLLHYLNKDGHAKVFCTGAFWANETADFALEAAVKAMGGQYVSLTEAQGDEYRALGLFEHSGVAAHPGDAGMKKIASLIYAAMGRGGVLSPAVVYPLPEGEPESLDYAVTVDGQTAPCYQCRVSAYPLNWPWPGHQRPVEQSELASFLYFDMTGPAAVSVTLPRNFTDAVLRPLSKGVQLRAEGRTISFTVSQPGQYSLEVDGRHHNLHIFANPVETYKVRKDDPSVIYFGPGIHEAGTVELTDGQTLFVDAGAVVHGAVHCQDSDNVRIIGHGILDYSRCERSVPLVWEKDGLVNLVRCENVRVDGVILRDSSWWTITSFNCRSLHFHNVKTIGMWRYNTDGFDFVNCQNVRVSSCFLRNFDDVIVVKGTRFYNMDGDRQIPMVYEYMNPQNYVIENCVIWCDWGGAFEFGAETVADEYCNFVYRNCDIICNQDGGMRIHSGDRAFIHNVLYEDIRVEYSKYDAKSVFQTVEGEEYHWEHNLANPIRIFMYCGVWSKDMIPGNIRDIRYRNIRILADEGLPVPALSFTGCDADHTIDGITIDGLYFNGRRITSPEEITIHTNEFAHNITLR